MSNVSPVLTPYAVICPTDGQVFLTEQEYERQLMRADKRWTCPKCGDISDWNDDNYELYLTKEE